MAQAFKETAHLNTDREKFSEGWDRIFGKKEEKTESDDAIAPCKEQEEQKE